MLGFARRELVPIRRVAGLAGRDTERGLPGPRIDAERRLEPSGCPGAELRRPVEAVARDRVPADAGAVARGEGADGEERRNIRREADGGERAAVAADLVHAEGRADLLDALAKRLDEVRQRVGIAGGERVLEKEVRVHRIRAEA